MQPPRRAQLNRSCNVAIASYSSGVGSREPEDAAPELYISGYHDLLVVPQSSHERGSTSASGGAIAPPDVLDGCRLL